MKKILISILALFLTYPVIAKEVWQGEFSPPNKSLTNTRGYQPSIIIAVVANIDLAADGKIVGTVTLTGNQVRCFGEAKIESGSINGPIVQITTEPFPIHNCGRFIFKGEVINGAWVGSIPWNSTTNPLTLKRE
jgi:hypothetical protein